MKIKKNREHRDLKNLTDVAKLFYFEELAPYIPQNRAFRSVTIIADYEHNAVFLKTEPAFVNQKLLEERPDLFTEAYTEDHDDSLDDITLHVLNRYVDEMGDIETSILQKLESSIFDAARSGQLNVLRRRKCDFIKSCDEISGTDAENVANDIFKAFVCNGRLMLQRMQTTFSFESHILLDGTCAREALGLYCE